MNIGKIKMQGRCNTMQIYREQIQRRIQDNKRSLSFIKIHQDFNEINYVNGFQEFQDSQVFCRRGKNFAGVYLGGLQAPFKTATLIE